MSATPRKRGREPARPSSDPLAEGGQAGRVPPAAAPCPVVGIGASAGGLDGLRKLFAAMPADSGMAFVVVQHLDPRHETLLPELLRHSTGLKVDSAADNVR
ncbi:MAG: chemotaxis protein CheB, partial [Candidatus Binatia bacterium]